MRNLLAAVTLAAAVSFTTGVKADLIVNGSFENGTNPGVYTSLSAGSTAITGWVVTPVNIDYIGTLWTASDGSRSLDLSGSTIGGISQTFATTIGGAYSATFDLAGNPGDSPSIKTVVVAAGLNSQSFTFNTAGKTVTNMGWTMMTFNFTANAATTTLTFTSGNASSAGPALDNVHVNARLVPEPASALLVACGALGLLGARFRRKMAS